MNYIIHEYPTDVYTHTTVVYFKISILVIYEYILSKPILLCGAVFLDKEKLAQKALAYQGTLMHVLSKGVLMLIYVHFLLSFALSH